jgi:hypothetical protein
VSGWGEIEVAINMYLFTFALFVRVLLCETYTVRLPLFPLSHPRNPLSQSQFFQNAKEKIQKERRTMRQPGIEPIST